MSSYETAIARMYALGHELTQTPSHKFDLAHMRILLGALDNPERNFPGVLIAGTNGKGSTAATLASILRVSGLRTALYTSPHLARINERIQIGGEQGFRQISDDDFALVHDLVDRTAERLVGEGELPWHPSFFEMLTAMAFEYFARRKVDIAVLEVGMGGRLDATNVIEPRVSVITDISLDHQKFLGNTVTEIAGEKAGIIRRGGVVVTLPQQPQANDVIGNRILELEARAVNAVPYVPPVSPASSEYLSLSSTKTPVSRYPLQVMGEQILVETPCWVDINCVTSLSQLRQRRNWVGKGFQLRPIRLSKVSGKRIGRAAFRLWSPAIPNLYLMWHIIRPGHGRCVRLFPLGIRIARSRLFLGRCGTRRSERWRKYCFPWRTG